MSDDGDEGVVVVAGDRDRVLAWRLGEALQLGASVAQAERFAESDGDLGRLRELVAVGCDIRLAIKIIV